MELDYLASEFERASLGLQDGATLKAAEAFLTSLTEHPDALLICKSVLDRSQNPLALFHASVTIRRRIYRDFFVLPGADVVAFRDYLLGCCMKLPSLPAPTSSTLLQSVAVICKLGWLRDGEREVTNFLSAVVSLLPQAGRERFAILDLLLSLLGEFSANGAIQYGVSDELHLACKLQFQVPSRRPGLARYGKAFLLRIFLSSCEVLQGWRVAQPPTPQPDLRLGVQVCRLLEGLLLWDFGREVRRADFNPTDPSDAGSPVEAYVGARHWRYGVPRVFPEGWKPYVTNLDFWTCCSSLTGGSRPILKAGQPWTNELDRDQFLSLEAKLHFTRQFILHLSNLIAKWHATHNRAEPHLLTIAQILGGVLGSGPFSELVQVAGFRELVEQAVQLTLACLRFGADDRDAASGEALEILLDIWAALGRLAMTSEPFLASAFVEHARDLDGQNCASLQQLGRTLFDAYVSSCQDCATHEIYSGLKVASSYKDWVSGRRTFVNPYQVQYEDQMLSIGTLARVVPDHAVKRLCERFNVEFSEIEPSSNLPNATPRAAFERVRWLLIVTGYVLAYTGPGEEASIPVALNNLSNRHPDPDLDPVIQLPGLVFSMLEFLTFHPDDIKVRLKFWGPKLISQALSCSAELAETFFWFIERWAHTYLFPNKEGYVSVSNHLLRVFGTSSHETAGRVVLDMLLDKIRRNFQLWANCAPTAAQISRVLLHLVGRKESRLVLFNSRKWGRGHALTFPAKFNELAKVLMGSLEPAGEEANRCILSEAG
ncbi:hypothetical protein L0F63_003333 [Massospora cicadina]|nr:hypothetical protein L0F63_003333 [Massospora cicadina]